MSIKAFLDSIESEASRTGTETWEQIEKFWQQHDAEQEQGSREMTAHWFSHPLVLLERFRECCFMRSVVSCLSMTIATSGGCRGMR